MLILHRSARADQLVAALGRLLAEPLADPVTPEVVSVPTRGVERWITQRLSHRLGAGTGGGGVCANLDFPFPGTLVARAMAQATGVDSSEDPWAPERAVWPLIDILDDHAGDPALAPIVQHLRAATPPDRRGAETAPRRFSVARHLADLFDRYAVHRPEMLREWAVSADPVGWQPRLWLLLRDRIGVASPAERLPGAVQAISGRPGLLDMPERLSVFGLTRLPAGHLQVLTALGEGRDVHLFLLHPSGCLWERVADHLSTHAGVMSRAEDPTRRLPTSPLLRSWGRDAREMQVVLAAHGVSGGHHYPVEAGSEGSPPTLLRRIQDDIRADRAPAGDRLELGPADDSLRVYACHGRARQVEVLRDAILHLLQDDPDLEARDVIVMCPDIEAFAPLIQAAFGVAADAPEGQPSPGGPPQLRVRLADRSLRQTNSLLSVAALLLDLAGSRVTASAVLDLAARPPVARRFGFDREQLATIERWVADTGVHWGFDAEHRSQWVLGRLADNTWSSGLDRLALGVAMADTGSRVFADTVPYDDLPSTSVELTGRLAEMVSRLRLAVAGLAGRRPLRAWAEALVSGTESLALAAPGESWELDQLRRTLAEAVDEAGSGPGADAPLGLEEVRSLLAGRLAGRPTRANFRTGDLTFCTLVPMRSVPHRVVALLGLDDGAFPRHPEPDGDDLLLADPRVGDREARAEDRQLVLDALLAADDHLIVTYSGRDERTNRVRPPCAPVAELLDVVDATARGADGRPARELVVVHHPLQPFDRRNFTDGALGRAGAWSFDPVHLDGARVTSAQHPRRPWLDGPLPPRPQPVLHLEDLIHFVQHPVRAFLRQRLSLYLTDRDVDVSDSLPLELDALQKWAIGDRLLEAGLAGVPLERAARAEELRGLLPPRSIASPVLEDVRGDVESILAAMSGLGFPPGPAESCEVRVGLLDGRLLVGSVPNVRGSAIVQCVYSKLAAKHRLAAWLRFLALTADRPERPVRSVSVGKGQRANPVSVVRLETVAGSPEERRLWALDRLDRLVRLYDLGMREPLPLVCKTSAAWAEGRRDRLDQPEMLARAQQPWDGGAFGRECDEDEHVFVYGRGYAFRSLLQDPPTVEDRALGWPVGERSRFGGLARLLWDPVLDAEEQGL
ncbi:MAG TPA: exodeoxyribonuclease V subunit gamma [Acidimicrobiales bacterium]|nr:exodeoxyribonuclease V subunit gamma [Acidimicrobiales bacterium]